MRITLLIGFFVIAALIAVAAGVSLLVPGPFDAIWRIKPAEHAVLAVWAPASGVGFLALGGFMAAAAIGLYQRRRWGWRLAIGIFTINGLGDAGRALTGAMLEGLIGVAVAVALIWWLTRRSVRAEFAA